ncbi:MAG: ubiquinol-cytochrome C chaperone family protein [Methyloligellaceae bacterium]
MLQWFTQRRSRHQAAQKIYDSIVGQARHPTFYGALGVGDRLEARFELLVLHVFLVLDRLQRDGSDGAAIGQELVDAFVRDMDTTLRELGVGDLSVPKKVRLTAAVFHDRLQDYRKALAVTDQGPLEATLERYVFSDPDPRPESTVQLAAYTRAAALRLNNQKLGEISSGRIDFPEPVRELDGSSP